jgi:nucleoid-associated protein YgaU
MGKETKIGLAVIGLLVLVFAGLLARRLHTTGVPVTSPSSLARPVAPAPLPGAAERDRIVVAQKNPHEHQPVGLGRSSGRGPVAETLRAQESAALNRGFMPADSVGQPAADRDAEPAADHSETPAFDEPAAAHPASPAAEMPAAEENFELAPSGTDTDLPQSSLPPLEIEPTISQPPGENPLRRTSAAEPLAQESDSGAEAPPLETAVEASPVEAGAEQPLPDAPPDERSAADPVLEDREFATTDARVSPVADEREVAAADEPQPESAPARREWRESAPAEPLPPAEPPADGKYTVQPNDNLWLISEKVYGTGGYFKALYEFNRARLPRPNQLVVGSVLMVPPVTTLEQNFPGLCPKQRKSAVVRVRTLPTSTAGRRSSDGVYVVAQGDTLFDIARYELGKASRWTEIYELNRDVLGEDFDYLRPGLELTMPTKGQPTDSFTRQDDAVLKR